jgi:excisionase family DNA binding protein
MSLETLLGDLVRAAVRDEIKPLKDELRAALAEGAQRQSEQARDEGFLTVEQVASRLKVTEPTVRDWIKSGALRASKLNIGEKVGRLYRVLPADLEAFVRAGQSARVRSEVDIQAEAARIVSLAASRRKT